MQHSRQISGQHDRRSAGVTEPPSTVAQIIYVVATLDVEREAHFLPQPVFIQGQCRTIDCLDRHLATLRATADPTAPAVTPDLRPMLLAVGAEHKRLIQHCWAGKTNQIAVRIADAWEYHVPKIGWLCYVEDEAKLSAYKSTGWSAGLAI